MTHSKWIPFFVLGALAALLTPAPLRGQAAKIGAIDTQRVLFESAAGMAAGEEFRVYQAERQQGLVDLQTQITQKSQELETQQRALSPEALTQRQQELQRLNTQFQREQEDVAADLEAKQQTVLQPVVLLANEVLEQYAQEQNYLMIVDVTTNVLAYMAPAADISTEIIRRMDDRSGPATSPAPAADAPAVTPEPAAPAADPPAATPE